MNESHIFANALKLATPAERAAYLDEACDDDPALRAAVEALLHAQASDPDFLEQPAESATGTVNPPTDPPTATADPVPVEQPGIVLASRYKLLEEIGEGGMGTVWMAQQTEPVKRMVAVKLIKRGMDTRQVLARFEAERQALALMDHPNIAKVHDAGVTQDGRPFFVMELVKGVPITKFCDDHRLTPRQRLELFVPVCHAIQHAHQKGVIHRDLKPSNVLVALYDDRPVPKVIDFGVAKATGQQLTERTLHTGFGAVVGTVEYMSPEQATFNQLDIDTRSDVYSLGVLLYELLTGSPPFSKEDLHEVGMLEMLRVIREREPSKPSTKLSTANGLPTLAANRGMEPGKLTRLVRGDLDWIVMKALEKDRSRRYETANGLARDLQRYLADEVVEARPPSAGYRFRKFLRRNKGRVLASTALTLSLLAGVTAVWVVQAQAARDRAAAETDRATREVWTTASVSAACREARERTDEAWTVTDYPDRMQQSTDTALAALRRADDYAASGLPSEDTRAELESTRRDVDNLARHARLVKAIDDRARKFANELGAKNQEAPQSSQWVSFSRLHDALKQFGIDPIDGDTDEVARAIAASPIRDNILGVLLNWHSKTTVYNELVMKKSAWARSINPDARRIHDSLTRVIRAARLRAGGAYTQWQELIDRNNVPGLIAFSATPEALRFRSTLVGSMARDLSIASANEASKSYLRAGIDRYPHDAWLHADLASACRVYLPPGNTEALRHQSAACAILPESAWFHLMLAIDYGPLGSYEQAVAEYRKVISMSPFYSAHANLWMGQLLTQNKDWERAIPAFREAIRLLPESRLEMWLPQAHLGLGQALAGAGRYDEAIEPYRDSIRLEPDQAVVHLYLGMALIRAGRHSEARETTLASLRQFPAWAENPRNSLRYNAACYTMNCADGKGANALAPEDRPTYRKQALEFLTAELAAVRKLVAERELVHRWMQHWLVDEDLLSVREPKALELLPEYERDAWNKLWREVRELRDRTAPPEKAPQPRATK